MAWGRGSMTYVAIYLLFLLCLLLYPRCRSCIPQTSCSLSGRPRLVDPKDSRISRKVHTVYWIQSDKHKQPFQISRQRWWKWSNNLRHRLNTREFTGRGEKSTGRRVVWKTMNNICQTDEDDLGKRYIYREKAETIREGNHTDGKDERVMTPNNTYATFKMKQEVAKTQGPHWTQGT